jgi:dodecin
LNTIEGRGLIAVLTAILYSIMLRKPSRLSDHIYKRIELVGSSPVGIEDAVQNALSKASKSLRNLRWFEVLETRGHVEGGKIDHWQATIKVGFTLEG